MLTPIPYVPTGWGNPREPRAQDGNDAIGNGYGGGMLIENVQLEEKAGGKSGHWKRSDFPDA